MGRPFHADGRQTRQAILDAALELFADKGYFGTSLRDIAAVVGVRESALYNYFPGKEALFSALITAAHEHKTELMAGLLAEPIGNVQSLLERLTALVLDSFAVPRQQQLFRVLMSDGMRLAKQGRINLIERMTSGAEPLHDLMRRLITEGGLRPRNSELLAIEFTGPLLLWRHWHAVQPNGPLVTNRQAFIRDHVAHFLHGATTPSIRRAPAGLRKKNVQTKIARARRAPAARARSRSKATS
jgi:AcrR family transcriptional regulator